MGLLEKAGKISDEDKKIPVEDAIRVAMHIWRPLAFPIPNEVCGLATLVDNLYLQCKLFW